MKGKVLLIFLISIIILPIYGVEQIPEWVKYNAKLWSENQIDDQSFLNLFFACMRPFNFYNEKKSLGLYVILIFLLKW